MPRTAERPGGEPAGLRADALRNRQRVVAAARELFVEHGVDVPLETIARRAGVGIATLYRRFPDRDSLVTAVARDAFTAVRDLADEVADADRTPRLQRFVMGLAELRVGVLMTSIWPAVTALDETPELTEVFAQLLSSAERLLEEARRHGELREDVDAQDVLLLLAAVTRPLEGLPRSFVEAVTPRLLALTIEGLRPRDDGQRLPARPPAPDPATLGNLR